MKQRLHRFKWVRGVLATALALLVVADNRTHAQGLRVAQHLKKLDGLLRLDVDQQAGGARRVLIRTTAADKETLRQLLPSVAESLSPSDNGPGGVDFDALGVNVEDVRDFALNGLKRRLELIGVPLETL